MMSIVAGGRPRETKRTQIVLAVYETCQEVIV